MVWIDGNKNGILDPGETAMAGVEVKLHGCTGSHTGSGDVCQMGPELGSRTTDKDGKYYFSNILPGHYFIEIVLPCQYSLTSRDEGKDDWKDSDFDPLTRHTCCISLTPGEVNLTLDAGIYPTPPATLGDYVWNDANKNGIQDAGEKGLCGVTVELYMCGVSKAVATARTDDMGKYLFRNVISNTSYSLKFYLPRGYKFSPLDQGGNDSFDSDVCQSSQMTRYYDLLPDETNLNADCGMYLMTTTACSYVWNDENRNGLKDESEGGVQGVVLELYECQGSTLFARAETDQSGMFRFSDIPLESYYMKILVPEGYVISASAVHQENPEGIPGGLNSPGYTADGKSDCFELTEGMTSIGSPIALSASSTTGISLSRPGKPTSFDLSQNYPNPFNPSTAINFSIPEQGQYTLKVYNTLGQEVMTLINGEIPSGYHSVQFNAGRRLSSGIYIYRLSGRNVNMIRKMILSK
jgi:hypothetical protein